MVSLGATTAAVVKATMAAAIIAVLAAPSAVSSRKSHESAGCSHQSSRPNMILGSSTKVRRPPLAWGYRGSPDAADSIQKNDGRRYTSFDGKSITSDDDTSWIDPSWTHAAFRAFHELRAGRPHQQLSAVDAIASGKRQDAPVIKDKGPFAPLRRQIALLLPERFHAEERNEMAADEEDSTPSSPPKPACWHMKGRLTSTATGRTIALVEGVELSRSLAFEVAKSRRERTRGASSGRLTGATASDGGGDGEQLEVDRVLKPGAWTAFGALASSKFFMYQNPDTGEPMEFFRHTPVDKKQPVRTYERFSQVVSHLLQPNGRILVVSEWGDRSVKAETANTNGVEEVGGDVSSGYGRGGGDADNGGNLRRVFNLHFFVEARTPKEERELKRRENRPGAKWVAFGATPPRSHGCKEVYSYVSGGEGDGQRVGLGARTASPGTGVLRRIGLARGLGQRSGHTLDAAGSSVVAEPRKRRGGAGVMTYTRYGECPSWYGTGQMCGLDVQAKRVDSFADIPAKLRERVLEVDPDFESGPPSSLEECRIRAAVEKRAHKEARRDNRRSLRRPLGRWGRGQE